MPSGSASHLSSRFAQNGSSESEHKSSACEDKHAKVQAQLKRIEGKYEAAMRSAATTAVQTRMQPMLRKAQALQNKVSSD